MENKSTINSCFWFIYLPHLWCPSWTTAATSRPSFFICVHLVSGTWQSSDNSGLPKTWDDIWDWYPSPASTILWHIVAQRSWGCLPVFVKVCWPPVIQSSHAAYNLTLKTGQHQVASQQLCYHHKSVGPNYKAHSWFLRKQVHLIAWKIKHCDTWANIMHHMLN